MKLLSPEIYLRHNLKKEIPFIISITIGVCFIYIFSIFSATTDQMVRSVSYDFVKTYHIIYTDESHTLPKSVLKQIEDSKTCGPIPVRMNLSGLAYYRGGMGGTVMMTLNLFEDDVPTLLESYGIRLVKGRMPRNNQSEILVPREYAMQNHLAVGDFIGSSISDEYALQGKYRICGLTEGKVIFAAACQPENKTKKEVIQKGVMYRIDQMKTAEEKQLISRIPSDASVLNYEYYTQEYGIVLQSMKLLEYILTGIMVLILGISLGNLNRILYEKRRDEFSILYCVGYTKSKLFRKLWEEKFLLCMGSCLAGILFTGAAVWCVNFFFLIPRGKSLLPASINGLMTSLVMSLLVSIFSLFPCVTDFLQKTPHDF